ncbi:MAG: hypothetical protein MRY72_05125 [Aquisalinus sp.]|nr:hypothetical protein [Aquisalinus sp.]
MFYVLRTVGSIIGAIALAGALTVVKAQPSKVQAEVADYYAGAWVISDEEGNIICTMTLSSEIAGLIANEEFKLDAGTCPEPLKGAKRWELAKLREIIVWKGFANRLLTIEDYDRDGLFQGFTKDKQAVLVRPQSEAAIAFARGEQAIQTQGPDFLTPADYQGIWEVRRVKDNAKCRIVLLPPADEWTDPAITAGANCPGRLKRNVAWTSQAGQLILFSPRGQEFSGRIKGKNPLFIRGRTAGENSREWELTQVSNTVPASALAPQPTTPSPIGEWIFADSTNNRCIITFSEDGALSGTRNFDCPAGSGFWRTWRLEGERLIILGTLDSVFFSGDLMPDGRWVNRDDRNEYLVRP